MAISGTSFATEAHVQVFFGTLPCGCDRCYARAITTTVPVGASSRDIGDLVIYRILVNGYANAAGPYKNGCFFGIIRNTANIYCLSVNIY
ncbi:hypothetical protein KK062_06365 [Fulvivirgaceae bacterium PWU5]|uniref:Uncharacterized protein n=1 Tax=Dawidia cretensis TaxID=2782350 RepID=A0AAP2GP16_9BACT|nr:hypothetical protein [Dawidia cretensis]MBT1707834.1 hypothetical protein [Dawidia cretensis]